MSRKNNENPTIAAASQGALAYEKYEADLWDMMTPERCVGYPEFKYDAPVLLPLQSQNG